MNDKVDHLKNLGSKETEYAYESPNSSMLETFPNQFDHRGYEVTFRTEEFTSLCPKTGQPDFADISINYIPDKECIETKSLKLYLFSFRNHRSFMETITNKILEDLVKVCSPHRMEVVCDFKTRGGIEVTVTAEYAKY